MQPEQVDAAAGSDGDAWLGYPGALEGDPAILQHPQRVRVAQALDLMEVHVHRERPALREPRDPPPAPEALGRDVPVAASGVVKEPRQPPRGSLESGGSCQPQLDLRFLTQRGGEADLRGVVTLYYRPAAEPPLKFPLHRADYSLEV
jgi:hypothetical protein